MGRIKPTGRLGELAKIRAEGKREVFDPMSQMKEQAMRRASMPTPDRRPDVVHPSEMCKTDWCIRATYWRISGKPQPDREFNWVLENIFAEGHASHEWWQSLLVDAGELFGSWRCKICDRMVHNITSKELDRDEPCAGVYDGHFDVPHMWEYAEVRLDHGLIAGKSDGAIRDTMLEFKTVGMGTLRVEAPNYLKKYFLPEVKLYDLDRAWKELRRPLPGHIRQGNVYLYLAHKSGLTQFERMTYFYQFKANQQVKTFSVKYSEDIMKPLLHRVSLIEEAVGRGLPPNCEFGGCEQCQAYEGDSGEGNKASADKPEAGRVVTRGSARAGEAGPGDRPRPARRGAPRTALGADRDEGPGADVPDARPGRVGRVPRVPAQRGRGGRTVRRTARREIGGPRSRQE